MFALGVVVTWVVVVVIAVLAVAVALRGAVVSVDDQLTTTATLDEVDQRLMTAAASLPGTDISSISPGQLSLSTTFTPSWVILLAVLLFPIGLVLLLIPRSKLELHARAFQQGPQVRVQVAGRTRKRTALEFGQRLQHSL